MVGAVAAMAGEPELAAVVRAEVEQALDGLLGSADRELIWAEGRDAGGRLVRRGYSGEEAAKQAAREMLRAGYTDVAVVDRRGPVGTWRAVGEERR